MIEVIDIKTNQMQTFEDISLSDVIHALQWVAKEKLRQKSKYQKYHLGTGRPRGRPRKSSPVEDS